MSLLHAETPDLIAELVRRVGPVAYQANRDHFDALGHLIGVEQRHFDSTINQPKE